MEVLRTPDQRFDDLPGYAFAPHYAEIPDQDDGVLRVHYLEEGSPTAECVLLMHGEPSWSYLYRHMIPVLVGAGLRVVAPDLVGFGRSDKPTPRTEYSYARHVEWMRSLLFDVLDLDGVTLVGQDWGGLIGLRLVAEHPERFARVVTANTSLPTGSGEPSAAFLSWLEILPGGRRLSGRQHRQRRMRHRPRSRDHRRLRRALPRSELHRGGPPVPHPGAHHTGRSGVGGQPGRMGGPGPVGQALSDRLQRR